MQKLAITVELYKDGEPLRLSGASNAFLMRYRMMSETDVAIPEVTLTVKDGDLTATSAATDSPITVSDDESCTVKSQVNWADNGDVRNKSVVLKAKQGFYLTKDTKFNVVGANSITATWLYSTDGGQTENPHWEIAMQQYLQYLSDHGVPDDQIYYMSHTIAAGLLGIE